ncbi:hypothetical protein BDN71DRAFT_1483901 [Pleurotus eryngii]|uniref:Uncharacterized protein n=1 Tax=Pleurotus eryngii TaxID=5323 RepID=A0A9P5ZS48_PLEER|nr:hypothetical protein BDN71DRAFT_1483901 [Pleurotus eryngii]
MMGSDDEEWDFLQTSVAEEQGLEPECKQIEQTVIPMDDEDGVPMCLRGGVDNDLQKNPFIVAYPDLQAGEILLKRGRNMDTEYTACIGNHLTNPYFPFNSTAFTELMQIEYLSENLGISFTNSKELNAMIDDHLPGRSQFKRHEILVGGEVCEVFYRNVVACICALFGDSDFMPYLVFCPEKHYVDETKAECMFHNMHTELDKTNPGTTIIPIIISSNKTQLTLFHNKSAYPLYLTIGNISKEICCKPSKCTYVLLAYLPVMKLEGVTNKASHCRQLANLYHACLSHILAPLRLAGLDGIFLTSGDGCIRHSHPLLASFISDYPEQILVTGTKSGCLTCPAKPNELGIWLKDLDAILKAIDSFNLNPEGFLQACKEVGLKPIVNPFWKDLLYAHIYQSITPDMLHQLLQGVLKHVISWITEACGTPEIDARCRCMPPNHNEHDQMCCILLGSVFNTCLIWAVRAILDFLYLAQYPVHTDYTLEEFHSNKAIFIDLGIQDSFNIPKLHFAKYYVRFIKLYEYTEQLHIDLAKDAYKATNHKDKFQQMTVWLERKEKILRHHQYHASIPNVLLSQIKLWDVCLPFNKLPIWHQIKFQRTDLLNNKILTADSIHCYHVAHIHVVFSLPESSLEVLFNDGIENLGDGSLITEVIPLVNIRQSAHLYPQFSPFAPVEWTSSTVLNKCDTFFVNMFTDGHMYRIVVV